MGAALARLSLAAAANRRLALLKAMNHFQIEMLVMVATIALAAALLTLIMFVKDSWWR
jgi:hypothetical protein